LFLKTIAKSREKNSIDKKKQKLWDKNAARCAVVLKVKLIHEKAEQ
jgi:hypothetical protein